MSRVEAMEQYNAALKLGKKYYSACVAKGQSPYPAVLEEILADKQTVGVEKIGLVDIPMDRIVGTWTDGRKMAFAGNFMPLLEADSEFGGKWISLCDAHLGAEGITDPIACLEYMGKFYVQEGHKRVSVLKSYDSPSIPGLVTRMIPAQTDEKDVQIYYEFIRFYKLSKTYLPTFSQLGCYARLQAALGLAPEQEWTEDDRREFNSDYRRFSIVFNQLNTEKLPLTAGDCLLAYVQVHSFAEMRKMTEDTLRESLASMWPDMRILAKGGPISVSAEPQENEKGPSLLSRILGTPKVNVAFIYDFDPHKSAWASAHEQGQKYLEEKMGASVPISAHLCGEHPDETMEEAVQQGANVLFATSPILIDACRRIAAKYKNILVYNCSLSMPYAGVRSYYCRVYESKFVTGAIAGAMAANNRIGYVANYPIMGVTAAINAFALGARLTNPRAKIILKWSCLPGNPVQELMDEDVSVISNRDEDGAKPFLAWALGTYQVQGGGTLLPLASPRWNWGKYYQKTVQTILNAGIDAMRDSQRAINDWWGLSTGVVKVDMDERLPAGIKQLANILKNGIISDEIDPFLCPILDQTGKVISDGEKKFTAEEIMRMDWLCEPIEGSIPAFDDLMPVSQKLVRLLGIYRDSIPPKMEEAPQ
ncbi:MAG: BMP family ABC transporter substrate-binding protein [Clostridia bacterium]|nr:BMP family ABC transporter substrate-binding protein [Clostridia bacterium]